MWVDLYGSPKRSAEYCFLVGIVSFQGAGRPWWTLFLFRFLLPVFADVRYVVMICMCVCMCASLGSVCVSVVARPPSGYDALFPVSRCLSIVYRRCPSNRTLL